MKDNFDVSKRAAQSVFVCHTALNEINVSTYLLKILAISGGEIINHAHPGPLRCEPRSNVGTDETGSSCN
jgi:hypothetical protein